MKNISLLAGGKSKRMEKNKLLLSYHGLPLIFWQVEQLEKLGYKTHIITNKENKQLIENNILIKNYDNVSIYEDLVLDSGPLGAIYTALTNLQKETLIMAVDHPFFEPLLLEKLFQLINGFNAVIPITSKGIEPLFACYHPSCLNIIEQQLKKKIFKVSSTLSLLNVRWLHENEIKIIDPELKSFINLNTPEDVYRWL